MSAASMNARVADAAEIISLWPAPDMSVLAAGRGAPVALPSGLFGSAWGLLGDISEGTGAPVDYAAVGFLAVCASLIGGKRRVRPFPQSNWKEPAILWVGAVGDPSANKSPALDAITEPLRALERDHAVAHGETLLRWQEQTERAKVERSAWADLVKAAQKDGVGTPTLPANAVEPDEPHRRRTMIMDATPEAVGAILASNSVGTLHMRDELAGWLTSFDRYSPGGREFWLEAYGGRSFVIDRKGSKGALHIPFNGVSVLGGIQPEKMKAALLDTVDDGLVARFIWAWPDAIPFRRPRQIADMSKLESVYRRLDSLSWGVGMDCSDIPVTIPLSPEASDLFEQWAVSNETGIDDRGPLYKSFVGKMKGAVLRLALVAELAQWAMTDQQEPQSVSADTLGAAADFVDEYAKPMAQRVYGDASLPVVDRNAAILARYIIKHRLTSINARELRRAPHKSNLPSLRAGLAMDETISFLCDADWLRDAGTREGGSAGQRRKDYFVNPAVFGGANG